MYGIQRENYGNMENQSEMKFKSRTKHAHEKCIQAKQMKLNEMLRVLGDTGQAIHSQRWNETKTNSEYENYTICSKFDPKTVGEKIS